MDLKLQKMRMDEGENERGREPVTPTSQVLDTDSMSLYYHGVAEMEIPIHIPHAKQSIKDLFLTKIPRFSCIMRKDKKNRVVWWEKTEVNVDDHVFVPEFPPGLEQYDEFVNEYISSVDLRQLPKCRPLWEYHILNYKTSSAEATGILKMHHAMGDGASLMSLIFDCVTTESGDRPSYQLPSEPADFHINAYNSEMKSLHSGFLLKLWHEMVKFVLTMWFTLIDLTTLLQAQLKWGMDSKVAMRGSPGVEHMPRLFSHATFNMEDIFQIKNSVGGTLNDVIMGVVFYGLQRYLRITLSTGEEKCSAPDIDKKMEAMKLTGLALINTRPRSHRKKSNTKTAWGNRFGFLSVPIPMTRYEHPLDYVRKAKHIMDKKKMSMAALVINSVVYYITRIKGPEASGRAMYNTLSSTTLTVSNLAGPTEKVMMVGYPVKSFYFSVSGAPQTVMLTSISYMGNLRLQVITTKGYADAALLARCFAEGLEEMKASSCA